MTAADRQRAATVASLRANAARYAAAGMPAAAARAAAIADREDAAVEPAATRPAAPARPPAAGRGYPLPNLTDRDEEDIETNQRLAGWNEVYGA